MIDINEGNLYRMQLWFMMSLKYLTCKNNQHKSVGEHCKLVKGVG